MANQESKEAKAPEAAAPKAKKSKMTLILLVLLVVMAGAAGFLGWKYFKVAKANTTEQAEGKDGHSEDDEEEATDNKKSKKRKKGKEKEEVKEGATVSFEPFLVNLADKEASRYLKTSVRLLVRDKESAEGISKGDVLMPRVRDTILSILATKTSAEVTTHEGKEKLKQEILKQVNEYLPHEDAQEVFFTDFVVQL